jgi:ferric-dicitrate binding protein FerR (iron transport regulator)
MGIPREGPTRERLIRLEMEHDELRRDHNEERELNSKRHGEVMEKLDRLLDRSDPGTLPGLPKKPPAPTLVVPLTVGSLKEALQTLGWFAALAGAIGGGSYLGSSVNMRATAEEAAEEAVEEVVEEVAPPASAGSAGLPGLQP